MKIQCFRTRMLLVCCITFIQLSRAESALQPGVVYSIETKDPSTDKWGKKIYDTLILRDGKLIGNTPFGNDAWMVSSISTKGEKSVWAISLRKRYEETMAKFSGVRGLPSIYKKTFAKIPSSIVATSEVESANGDETILSVQKFMMGLPAGVKKLRIKPVKEFKGVKIVTQDLKKDSPNRFSYKESSDKAKPLASSVAQIIASEAGGEDSIDTGSEESGGTGFFLSKDGYFLTNHHVAASIPGCLKAFKCKLKLRMLQGDKMITKEVEGTLLTANKEHDIAFFKLEVPEDLRFTPLEIERTEISKDLLTVGYPGDRLSENQDDIDLTYSMGSLIGFHGRAFQTSVYISGGASGSPLLNKGNYKVVGIMSNGTGIEGKNGMPGIARPLLTIDHEFGLSDLISGEKQKRIDRMIVTLSVAQTGDEAKKVLNILESEKTFYGLDALKKILVCHPNPRVRKSILEHFEKIGHMQGTSSFDPSAETGMCTLPSRVESPIGESVSTQSPIEPVLDHGVDTTDD